MHAIDIGHNNRLQVAAGSSAAPSFSVSERLAVPGTPMHCSPLCVQWVTMQALSSHCSCPVADCQQQPRVPPCMSSTDDTSKQDSSNLSAVCRFFASVVVHCTLHRGFTWVAWRVGFSWFGHIYSICSAQTHNWLVLPSVHTRVPPCIRQRTQACMHAYAETKPWSPRLGA